MSYKDPVKKTAYFRSIRYKEHKKKYLNRIWEQVKTEYGSKCACCGETRDGFLTFAHKQNDGAVDRKLRYRFKIMREAIEHPDHERYEILCFNCNCGTYYNGGVCPHKEVG